MGFHCAGVLSLLLRFLLSFPPGKLPEGWAHPLLSLVVTGALISPAREDEGDFFISPRLDIRRSRFRIYRHLLRARARPAVPRRDKPPYPSFLRRSPFARRRRRNPPSGKERRGKENPGSANIRPTLRNILSLASGLADPLRPVCAPPLHPRPLRFLVEILRRSLSPPRGGFITAQSKAPYEPFCVDRARGESRSIIASRESLQV